MIHWHWNEVFHIFYITKINESMFPRRSKKLRMNRNDQNYNIRNLLIAQYSCRYHRRNLLPSTSSLASQFANYRPHWKSKEISNRKQMQLGIFRCFVQRHWNIFSLVIVMNEQLIYFRQRDHRYLFIFVFKL